MADPVDEIGGLNSSANVSKADFRSYEKARNVGVFADADEVRSYDLSGRSLIAVGSALYRSNSESVAGDDGISTIIDSGGLRWIKVPPPDVLPGRVARASDFGAFPSDNQEETAHDALNAALEWATEYGGELLIDEPGNYWIGQKVGIGNLVNDFIITMSGGAVLACVDGFNTSVLDIRNTDNPHTGQVTLNSPKIDNSRGTLIGGAGSNTGMAFWFLNRVVINEPNLYGGEEYDNENADSGIGVNATNYLEVNGGIIKGYADAGIYPSGYTPGVDETGQDYVVHVRGTRFVRCQNAMTPKRLLTLVKVSDIDVYECMQGIQTSWLLDPVIGPPKHIDIADSVFRRTVNYPLRFIADSPATVRGCTIIDWGYELDGVTAFGLAAPAIHIYGNNNVKIDDTLIEQRNYPNAGNRIGVLIQNVTINGTPYTAGNVRSNGLKFRRVPFGIYENEGTSNTKSRFLNASFESVGTRVRSNTPETDTVVTFTNDTLDIPYLQMAGVSTPMISGRRAAATTAAATVDLDIIKGDNVDVNGNDTISAITLGNGHEVECRFLGTPTLEHSASLILPGAANIAVAAGDTAVFRGRGSGVVVCTQLTRAAGLPIAPTAAGKAIAEAVDAPAQRTALSAAAKTQTEFLTGYIDFPSDKDYRLGVAIPVGFTIVTTTTRCESGSCTATFKINSTTVGGSANSVSASEDAQAHGSDNVGVAGDDIIMTISSNSSCVGMSFSIELARSLA